MKNGPESGPDFAKGLSATYGKESISDPLAFASSLRFALMQSTRFECHSFDQIFFKYSSSARSASSLKSSL
jgi:hypothetical protein